MNRCSAAPADERVAPTQVSSVASDTSVTVTLSRANGACEGSRLQVLAYEPSWVQVECDGVPVRLDEVRSLTPWSEPATRVQTHRDALLVSLAEVASGPWPAMEVVLTPLSEGTATCTLRAKPAKGSGRTVARR
ncbi:MAG: hypothetical protein AB8H79_12930 [Myxococcota bacterium]